MGREGPENRLWETWVFIPNLLLNHSEASGQCLIALIRGLVGIITSF